LVPSGNNKSYSTIEAGGATSTSDLNNKVLLTNLFESNVRGSITTILEQQKSNNNFQN
jgi:hypothetical protein